MALEQAIIELVLQGDAAFATKNDKIQADLTTTERAGRQAEASSAAAANAARQAEQASRQLASQIGQTLSKLSAAASFAQRAAGAFGVDPNSSLGGALNLGGDVLSSAASGAALGRVGGPIGAAVGAVVGGIVGGVASVRESDKKAAAEADRLEAAQARLHHQDREGAVLDAVLRQAGLAKIENLTGNGRSRTIR